MRNFKLRSKMQTTIFVSVILLNIILGVHSRNLKNSQQLAEHRLNFKRSLQLSPKYHVEWEVFSDDSITFTVQVETTGWIAFGISETAQTASSDVITGGVWKNGTTYFTDCHFKYSALPLVDLVQDWILLYGSEANGITTLKFSRKLDTKDPGTDVVIRDKYLYLTWAFHVSSDIPTASYPHYFTEAGRGATRVNLLEPPGGPPTSTASFETESTSTATPEVPTSAETTTESTSTATPEVPTTTTDSSSEPEPPSTTDLPSSSTPSDPISTTPKPSDGFTRTEKLSDIVQVTWTVDFETETVLFNVTANVTGYIGFGISDRGTMDGADLIVGGVFRGVPYLDDSHSIQAGKPAVDLIQNYQLLSGHERESHTNLVFSRVFDTTDPDDLPIEYKWTHFIWATSNCENLNGEDISGSFAVNILEPNPRVSN